MTIEQAQQPLVFIVSGPSGSGKSTLVKKMLEVPGTMFSISCHDAAPRARKAPENGMILYPKPNLIAGPARASFWSTPACSASISTARRGGGSRKRGARAWTWCWKLMYRAPSR